jgi:cytochrome oxidase Cu insertion factor (SCO1/SenC/PrrC family)
MVIQMNDRVIRRIQGGHFMLKRSRISLAALSLVLALPLVAQAALRVGEKAPNFTLPDQFGHSVSLSQFLGKQNVVLAFYVLAFTSG